MIRNRIKQIEHNSNIFCIQYFRTKFSDVEKTLIKTLTTNVRVKKQNALTCAAHREYTLARTPLVYNYKTQEAPKP